MYPPARYVEDLGGRWGEWPVATTTDGNNTFDVNADGYAAPRDFCSTARLVLCETASPADNAVS